MANNFFYSSNTKTKLKIIMQELNLKFKLPKELEKKLIVLFFIGLVLTAAGIIFAPSEIYPHILLAMNYVMGISVGAVVFLSMLYASNAGWGAAIKRIPEAMSTGILIGAAFLLLVFFGMHYLYEWAHASVVEHDKLLQQKTWWLDEKFFIVRNILFVAIWYLFAKSIRKNSLQQDETGEVKLTKKIKLTSVVFAIVFAFTGSLASFDWLMSLEPHWYSTIFGLYNITGILVCSLATIILVTTYLLKINVIDGYVNENHLHDLAKLTFAFSTFWIYLFFSQYLLIWYANIPEEVGYLIKRENGGWGVLTIMNLIFNWVIPFLVLLPRSTKKNEGVLLKVAIILLIGRWIDLFWMILPVFSKSPIISIWTFPPIITALSAFFLLTFKTLEKHNLIAKKDPMLVESLNYHS